MAARIPSFNYNTNITNILLIYSKAGHDQKGKQLKQIQFHSNNNKNAIWQQEKTHTRNNVTQIKQKSQKQTGKTQLKLKLL